MRRLPRRGWLLVAVGVVFILGTIVIQVLTPVGNDASLPAGTTLSAAPRGTLALSQWLEAEGYGVERVREFPFSGDGLAALFVIVPQAEFTDDEAKDVATFVEHGGTLILASDGSAGSAALEQALAIFVRAGKTGGGQMATPVGPTLGRPPVRTIAFAENVTVAPDLPNDVRFLPRAASADGTMVATMMRGTGRVHILSGAYPLTNEGLPKEDDLALVQNLVAGLPAGGRIGFDEFHHGYGLGSSIADRALRSPWGWTLCYLAALTFVAVALNGRRFGRPLPAPPVPPLAPAAYARALGNRWYERKQYAFAQEHAAARLKQRLAAMLGIDPALDDAAFLDALGHRRPDLATDCATLLATLRAETKNEARFVSLMRRVDDLLRRATEARAA